MGSFARIVGWGSRIQMDPHMFIPVLRSSSWLSDLGPGVVPPLLAPPESKSGAPLASKIPDEQFMFR